MCVFVCALPLYPATLGWDVRCGCVCLCSGFGCTPPLLVGVLGCVCVLLAGMCGVGVCACAPVLPRSRHSLLGCWGVCVIVCALRLYPATPGWGVPCGCVCLGSGVGCAPPLLAGLLGHVCVCVRALLVPRHSWLECAVWACLLRLGFRICPATPGWGVGVCVCLCVCSACTPPLLAGWAAWLCVLGLGFRLHPATPGWGVGGFGRRAIATEEK